MLLPKDGEIGDAGIMFRLEINHLSYAKIIPKIIKALIKID
jgi:hypothetical protein